MGHKHRDILMGYNQNNTPRLGPHEGVSPFEGFWACYYGFPTIEDLPKNPHYYVLSSYPFIWSGIEAYFVGVDEYGPAQN